MKALTLDQQAQCKALDCLINHYYAGHTAAFIRSEGGDDSNISKMRRGIIAVSKRYRPLLGIANKINISGVLK